MLEGVERCDWVCGVLSGTRLQDVMRVPPATATTTDLSNRAIDSFCNIEALNIPAHLRGGGLRAHLESLGYAISDVRPHRSYLESCYF